jgi:hypothetical protein
VPVVFIGNHQTCDVEHDGASCLAPFRLYLAIFAVLAVPFAMAELKEQKCMSAFDAA